MRDVETAHIWSRGSLLAVPVCPMCHGASRVALGEATDAMVPSPDSWPLWRCETCRSQWLDPRPDDASLPAAYDFDYITHRAEGGPARAGFVSSLINGYLASRFQLKRDGGSRLGAWFFPCVPPLRMKLDYFGRHLQPGKGRSLLDIGCGSGDFVATAGFMGWNAEGVDPDAAAVAVCRSRGIVVTEGFVEQIEANKQVGYWDAVTMSHCMEHVPNPGALLAQVHAMLAPGGEVWLGLPNPESIGARYFGLDWESIDAPRHLVLPTQAALIGACRAAGFESIRLKRRGAHSGRLYRRSVEIARARGRHGIRFNRHVVSLLSLGADLLATLTARWGDETVLVARKRTAR